MNAYVTCAWFALFDHDAINGYTVMVQLIKWQLGKKVNLVLERLKLTAVLTVHT